jgi:hypothetical protein
VNPAPSLLTVTLAPGTTEPLASVTVPRIVAVVFWANEGMAIAARSKVRQAVVLRIEGRLRFLS